MTSNVVGCLSLWWLPFSLLYLWIVEPDYARFYTAALWIKRAYKKRRWERVARLAQRYLAQAERYHRDWNYGNAIHDGNQWLGLARLQQGGIEGAKECLVRAGLSPGSPQLDSFGPSMTLARELLQRGERTAVAEYVDLIAQFWTREKAYHADISGHSELMAEKQRLLEEWKVDIAAGRVPDYYLWRQPV